MSAHSSIMECNAPHRYDGEASEFNNCTISASCTLYRLDNSMSISVSHVVDRISLAPASKIEHS